MSTFKHILVAMATALLALLCVACSGDSEGTAYAAFQRVPGGKWGMINMTTGEVLFEDAFAADCQLSRGTRGVFWVKDARGDYRLYSCEREPRELAGPFSQVADFFDDVAPVVRRDSCITVIGTDGRERFRLDKVDGKAVTTCSNFNHGVATVSCGDTGALIDRDGNVLVPTGKYASFVLSGDSLVLAFQHDVTRSLDCIRGKGTVDVLDLEGKRVGGFELTRFGEVTTGFFMGLLAASDHDGRWGLIDRDGKWVVQPGDKVSKIFARNSLNSHGDKFVFMSASSKCGVMSTAGNVLIEANYGGIMLNKDHYVAVETSAGKWELHDYNDKKLAGSADYLKLLPPSGDATLTFAEEQENRWVVLNEAGETLELVDKDGKPFKPAHVTTAMVNREVKSEFFNLDAVVAEMRLAPDGMLGMNLNMPPREVAPLLRAVDKRQLPIDTVAFPQGDDGAQHWAGTEKIMSVPCAMGAAAATARVEYTTRPVTEIRGITHDPMEMLDNTVYAGREATLGYRYIDSIAPASLSVTIEANEVLKGEKMNRLTQRLIDKVKSLGTPLAANANAAVVTVDNERTFLVFRDGEAVTVMLLRGDSTQDEADEFLRAHP